MVVVIIISIIAIFLTWTESHANFRHGMFCGYFLLAFLGCIHYKYGNDYLSYMDIFNDVGKFKGPISFFFKGSFEEEPGWLIVNKIFQPFGFFSLVAVYSIVINFVYYYFIRKNVDEQFWPLATAIYLFTTSLYLLHFSMLRQSLAMAICLLAWSFINHRRLFLSSLLLLLAFLIHKSAIIFLPFIFIGYFNFINVKSIGLIGILLLVFLSTNIDYIIITLLSLFQLEAMKEYTMYGGYEMQEVSYGLGYVIRIIPLFVFFYAMLNDYLSASQKRLAIIACVSYFIIPFTFIIPMVSRISFYFEAYSVAAIPILCSSIRSTYMKNGFILIYLLFILYQYYLFFTSDIWAPHYTNFRTIFETWF